MKRSNATTLSLISLCLLLLFPSLVRADEVLDWNAVVQRALVASGIPGAGQFRPAAIVHASIFDAVNGIDRKFTPIHVTAEAPRGASRRAAAVQAAYTALVALFPAQSDAFAQDLETSLAGIAADSAIEHSQSIARGREWGEQVAKEILAWRSTDGFNTPTPPFLGSNEVGKWRPTPPGFLPGLFPQLAHTLPWVIPSPSSFRPGGPPPLASAEYAADFNEVKVIGELGSTVRTTDQTEAARFWYGTVTTFWNRAAATAARQRDTNLSENARLFALLNVAMADGVISSWDAKYFYEFWRPITAIRLASTDGNPDTAEQADWTPLLVTPPYPEYTAGHPTTTGAAHAVLTIYFGDDMPVEGTSEGLPGVVRSWPNFTAAADEANEARIWAGIHFRTAVRDGRHAGDAIGAFVMVNAAQPVHSNHNND
jgi:hypothetical protein